MSRIGKNPIPILNAVKVQIVDRTVSVEGPKGKLSWTFRPEVEVQINESEKTIVVTRKDDDRLSRSLHGLTRSLIANMIEGCANGYTKALEIYGVGYGCQLQGNQLTVMAGYSHTVVLEVPAGITVTVATPQARGDNDPAKLSIEGADKQMVGEFAARIRKVRKPEPYKGKGVRYAGEQIRRKAGKAFAGAGSK